MSHHLAAALLALLPAADAPTKEPAYAGKPAYCCLAFDRDKSVVWLALDGDRLHIDRNANGNLTDDGDPVVASTDGSGDSAWQTFRVKELHVAGRTHRDLTLTVAALKSSGNDLASVTKLLAAKPDASSYRLTVEVEMPGRTGYGVGGRVPHNVGITDAGGVLQFAAKAADAPLVHFDGPLVVAPDEPATFIAGRQVDLMLVVGSRGEGPGTFAALAFERLIPAGVYPVAEVEFPPKTPGEPPVRERYELKQRC
jgi:hypothetical protein